MKEFVVKSVNISAQKGVVKKAADSIVLNETGIIGDAHSGKWHRQVSLLAQESIENAEKLAQTKFPFGTFAENITTQGIELHKTKILDRFVNSHVELEVTQIGKKCHAKCEIGRQIGNCIMPVEGIFCRVVDGGIIKAKDTFRYIPKVLKVNVISFQNKFSNEIDYNRNKAIINEMLTNHFNNENRRFTIEISLLPYNEKDLQQTLQAEAQNHTDIIIIIGNTGSSKCRNTPDMVQSMLFDGNKAYEESEHMKHLNTETKHGVSFYIQNTLTYCIPEGTKEITESLSKIMPTFESSLRIINRMYSH